MSDMSEPTPVRPPNPIDRIRSLLTTGPRAIVLRFYDQTWRRITGVPVWRLSEITPHLYIGGQHKPNGWQTMCDYGIIAVLNMREGVHDDVALQIGGEVHLHLATVDNTPVTFENLHRAADFIAEAAAQNGKVYVHCGVGVGRAPSAGAAYLIKYQQMDADEALEAIRAKRPFIHLTGPQREQLRAFAQQIRDAG